MNIDQILYFSTVVEEGTISGAAKRLHMSQPPVSMQIKNLENELGVKLFERGARQIRLTEAGKTLYSYAQKMIEIKNTAEEEMHDLSRGRKGNLKIGVISSGSCPEFFSGIKSFKKTHKDIHFKITDGNTYQLIDALKKNSIDLAVIRTPFLTTGLEMTSLRRDPMTIIGLPSLMKKYPNRPIHLHELGKESLILYRRWEKIIQTVAQEEKYKGNYFCVNDDARTSLQWAEAGLGIAIAPASSLSIAPKLAHRELAEKELYSEIMLVRREHDFSSEIADLFFQEFK